MDEEVKIMATLMDKVEEMRAKAKTKVTEVRVKAGLEPEGMVLGGVPIMDRVKAFREKRMVPGGGRGGAPAAPSTVRAGAERPKMIV